MNSPFITRIILEKVRNLEYTEIPLSEEKRKHVMFTGKNGSGKTTVLGALAKLLEEVVILNEWAIGNERLEKAEIPLETIKELNLPSEKWIEQEEKIDREKKKPLESQQGVQIEMNCPLEELQSAFTGGQFILAYYRADRTFMAEIPKQIEKVELQQSYLIRDTPRENIVKYLLDLKMTQALAVSAGKSEKAEKIQKWFEKFESLLREILENDQLKLEFDEETFRFYLMEPGKEPFDFNTLSSGYAAILDIVIDLMIRMERQTERRFQYDVPGIVLIDEIETHLHLELQKKILKFLIVTFPEIQFLVSTHSPFVLNSLENAVIYDLDQHRHLWQKRLKRSQAAMKSRMW